MPNAPSPTDQFSRREILALTAADIKSVIGPVPPALVRLTHALWIKFRLWANRTRNRPAQPDLHQPHQSASLARSILFTGHSGRLMLWKLSRAKSGEAQPGQSARYVPATKGS